LSRRLISSGSPFEEQAGYSRAVSDGDWCWVAGTTGRDPDTGVMPDDVAEQTRNAFRIIDAALDEAGFAMSDVVRATCYITSQRDFVRISPVMGEAFAGIRPAATCVVVAGLVSPEMKVEIEVTARKRR
jgi:enamine deaminase RidA (YjgF/YER057c/UK114 family)